MEFTKEKQKKYEAIWEMPKYEVMLSMLAACGSVSLQHLNYGKRHIL